MIGNSGIHDLEINNVGSVKTSDKTIETMACGMSGMRYILMKTTSHQEVRYILNQKGVFIVKMNIEITK